MEIVHKCSGVVLLYFYLATVAYANPSRNMTVSCTLDNSIELPCMLDEFKGLNVLWFNGKSEMLTSGVYVRKHSGRIEINKPAPNEWNLRINSVDQSFADTYTCQTNLGTVLSYITLVIETKPRLDEIDSLSVHFQEHSTATLACVASGIPEPEITWYRGQTEESIGITGKELIIKHVTRYASDEYTCRAKNKNGDDERHMQLIINFAPEVAVMESEVYAASGDIVIMACVVQASSLYDTYWTFKGAKIASNWKYEVTEEREYDHFPVRFLVLRIQKNRFSVHDSGRYTCHARGKDSEPEAFVELKMKQKHYGDPCSTFNECITIDSVCHDICTCNSDSHNYNSKADRCLPK